MSVINRAPQWESVILDRCGLLDGLTEIAWCAETKSTSAEELYDTYVDKTGESKREVSSEYATKFWLLREGYAMFLDSYIKKYNDDTDQTTGYSGTDNGGVVPEGEGQNTKQSQ